MINAQKEEGKITLTLDNGHLAALEKIVSDYNFVGEAEAITFILSVISKAGGKPINNGNGEFVPSDHLKKAPPTAESAT